MAAHLGIDVGGTFTDAVLITDGRVVVAKVPTRPDDIAAGFVDALRAACAAAAVSAGDLSYVVHGTTTATNAIVTRRLARTALVTNEGFRDLLEIGTQQRPDVYDLWTPHPSPLVAREDAFGVPGRIGPGGEELAPLDEAAVRAVAATLAAREIEAVAVTLLHSYAEPRHERRIGELLHDLLPGVPVSLSCGGHGHLAAAARQGLPRPRRGRPCPVRGSRRRRVRRARRLTASAPRPPARATVRRRRPSRRAASPPRGTRGRSTGGR